MPFPCNINFVYMDRRNLSPMHSPNFFPRCCWCWFLLFYLSASLFPATFFLIWSSYRFVSISSFRPFCRYYTFLSLVSIKYYYNFISVCFSSMRVEFYVALNWSMRFNAKQKQWQKIKTCVTDSFWIYKKNSIFFARSLSHSLFSLAKDLIVHKCFICIICATWPLHSNWIVISN